MNMLSNSMERLSMSQPIESLTVTEKKDINSKKHEGSLFIEQHKPVEHCNFIVAITKVHREIH